MRGVTRDGTLRIATAVMIAAMAVHVVHDLLRLRAQPALPLDGLGETTCFAAMIASAVASCARRRTNRPAQPFSVVAPLAVTFIALAIVLAVVFAPLRDLYLAADGVLACCAVWEAADWARRGLPPGEGTATMRPR